MTQTIIEKLQASYRDLDPLPLVEPEDIERFRVEYGREVLVRLKNEVEAAGKRGKVIFTGHRGCGKSTLLKQFAVEMQKNYFVSFFSVADLIEMSDVSHVNILYSIGLVLLSQATLAKIPVADDIKQSLLGWTDTTRKVVGEIETKSELGIGTDFFKVITAKLQQERTFREELEKTYEKNITDLVGKLDRLAAAIQTTTKKPVLVIIDDLDKLDLRVVEPIFRQNVKALFSPAFRIVFTIPVAASEDPIVMGALNSEGIVRPRRFPVTKFFTYEELRKPNAKPIEANVALFEQVLAKRFAPDLIRPETARKMVLASGGVLRELVRIGRECCIECMTQIEMQPDRANAYIDDVILMAVLSNLRNEFARQIQPSDYSLLVAVHKTLEQAEGETSIKMLHGLMVLEYENGDMWYDLHPIVLDLLRRKKLVE
jgi:nucleoside-triphosphatase THEP1